MINNTKNKWTWRRNKEVKTTQITTKETTNIDQTKINNPPKQNSKNRNATSAINRSQQENIDLLKVISFVEETMKTLTTRTTEDTIGLLFDPTGKVINLTKKLSTEMYLNKNLNFVPMQKVFQQKEIL